MRALLVACMVAGLSTPAFSQSMSPADISVAYAAADKNRDGFVDKDEYVRDFIAGFIVIDADGDDYVEASEMTDPDPARVAAADKNRDGRISYREALDVKMAQFVDLDADGDDRLTMFEVMNYARGQ